MLAATNGAMYGDLVSTELFITMFCARYDPATGRLEYASAGHNPPLLRAAASRAPTPTGSRSASLETVDFEEKTLSMGPGDRLLLSTDGAMEALDEAGNQFGEHRPRTLVEIGSGAHAARGFVDRAYAGRRRPAPRSAAQQDDITLVALHVDETAGGMVTR